MISRITLKYIFKHFVKFTLVVIACVSNLTIFVDAQSNPMDAHLHGRVTSGLTAQGLPGVEVKYRQITPTVDSLITYTNENGEYDFSITKVEETEGTESLGEIKYYWNNIISPREGMVTISDILGQKVLSQKISTGNNRINLQSLANGVYLSTLDIDGSIISNKILKLNDQYLPGTTNKSITTNQSLHKAADITYTLDFRDTTGGHYTYLVLDTKTLTQDQEFNTPMIPKGPVEIVFTDHTHTITNIKEFLLDLVGAYQLQAIAYGPTVKPIKTHLNEQELPAQYNIQDIRDATIEMMEETGLPIDSIYEETSDYLDPRWITESSVGYQYVESSVLQGYDFGVTLIIDAQAHKTSYIYQFNKETIEPEYIKKFVKLAWFGGITGGLPPVQGYFSSDGRNGIDTMLNSEKCLWRTDFQWSDKPTWLSVYNFPEDNGPFNRLNIRTEFMNEKTQSFEIGFKREGDSYKQVLITK